MFKRVVFSAVSLGLVAVYPGALGAQSRGAIASIVPHGFSTTVQPTPAKPAPKTDGDGDKDDGTKGKDNKCLEKLEKDKDNQKSPKTPPKPGQDPDSDGDKDPDCKAINPPKH